MRVWEGQKIIEQGQKINLLEEIKRKEEKRSAEQSGNEGRVEQAVR